MARKKDTSPVIVPFSNDKNSWWVNKKHYSLVDDEFKVIAGGIEDKKEIKLLKTFLNL